MNLPNEVIKIFDLFNKHNFKIYLVGGCVRDSLMNRTPHDWDFTTNALPEQMIEICNKENLDFVPTGIKHGTITIFINSIGFEITTFRTDGNYSDHRHSDEVIFVNDLIDDLSRRDLTINAIAYSINEGIIDPFNGKQHIKDKKIICVNDPIERFNEDALRTLRAIRFSCQLNFSINDNIVNAIKRLSDTIQLISKERIRDELTKILLTDKPSIGINLLVETKLMQFIIPELLDCVGFNQNNIHHNKDVFMHILGVVDNTNNNIIVRLAALLHDIGKPKCYTIGEDGQGHFNDHDSIGSEMSIKILKNLKFDNNTIEKVSVLIKEHMHTGEDYKKPAIKRLINRVGKENLDNLFNLQIADRKASAPDFQNIDSILNMKNISEDILNNNNVLSINSLAINGNDLINIGYQQGKEIGQKLQELLNLVIDEKEPNDRNRLLELAKK